MADLIERLRAVEGGEEGTNWYRNPDGPEAAARIAELEAALKVTAAVLQAEVTRCGGKPFTGTWSFPALDVRITVSEALDMADAALAAPDTGGAADGE